MVAMRQNYSQGMMIGLGAAFMFISIFFVGLRVFAKHLARRKLSWEDYLCFAALVSPSELPTKAHTDT
jgi:hypothetical protein